MRAVLVVLALLPSLALPLWAQAGTELPPITVEVPLLDLPSWDVIAPPLPDLPAPDLSPRLPELPPLDPEDPRWQPRPPVFPPLLTSPLPSALEDSGVRAALLAGLGSPYATAFSLQVEQRGSVGPELVFSWDFWGNQPTNPLPLRLTTFLGLGQEAWNLRLGFDWRSLPLEGLSTDGWTYQSRQRAYLQAKLGTTTNGWSGGLAGEILQSQLDQTGPWARLGRLSGVLEWTGRHDSDWIIQGGLEARVGWEGGIDYHGHGQAQPWAQAKGALSLSQALWHLRLEAKPGWNAERWSGRGRVLVELLPTPFDLRAWGRFYAEESEPPRVGAAEPWTLPLDTGWEGGGGIGWTHGEANLGLRLAWDLRYQRGLSTVRWVRPASPLGLAVAQTLERDRYLSRLEGELRWVLLRIALAWAYDFLAPDNGEQAHEGKAELELDLSPWRLAVSTALAQDPADPPLLSLHSAIQPGPRWELGVRLDEVLLAGGSVPRRRNSGDGTPGEAFSGLFYVRLTW